MRKSFVMKWLGIGMSVMLLIGCPDDSANTNNPETPNPETPNPDSVTKKLNVNGIQVINEIWGEPEEDPRCVMGYQLEGTDTPFFDRYVILYGGRVANHECATDPSTKCTKTGFHLHFDDNVQELLTNHVTYYKSLQDKGIKVLMGLVPKDGGVCIGSTGIWPMEDVYPWSANNEGKAYPFGPKATDKFIQEVVDALKTYQLDGVGYDEEYGNRKNTTGPGLGAVYPTYSGQYEYYTDSAKRTAAWKRGGENLFRFAYKLQQKMPGVIQDVYEIRYGSYIPQQLDIDGKTVKMTDVFDISFEAYYGSWQQDSAIKMPKTRFGPVSIDIGSGLQNNALPAPNTEGITQYMQDHLDGGYGVNMFYCLRSRDEMKTRSPNYFGSGVSDPEPYLTRMSNILYGKKIIYVGKDYPRLR